MPRTLSGTLYGPVKKPMKVSGNDRGLQAYSMQGLDHYRLDEQFTWNCMPTMLIILPTSHEIATKTKNVVRCSG